LLVHGRYSYRRIAKILLFSFFKNSALQFTQIWFFLVNGFSGQNYLDNSQLSLYNVVFTLFPIFSLSFFDQDVSPKESIEFPELYIYGQRKKMFSVQLFLTWILNGFYLSIIFFFFPYFILQYPIIEASGVTGGYLNPDHLSTIAMASIIYTVNLKVCFELKTYNIIHFICILLAILLYPAFLSIFHVLSWITSHDSTDLISLYLRQLFNSVYFDFYIIVQSPLCWFTFLLTITMAISKDFVYKVIKFNYFPELYNIIDKMDHDKKLRKFLKGHKIFKKLKPPQYRIKKNFLNVIKDLFKKKIKTENYEEIINDVIFWGNNIKDENNNENNDENNNENNYENNEKIIYESNELKDIVLEDGINEVPDINSEISEIKINNDN
jgi:magnesium-transporting ATPase (P-type)